MHVEVVSKSTKIILPFSKLHVKFLKSQIKNFCGKYKLKIFVEELKDFLTERFQWKLSIKFTFYLFKISKSKQNIDNLIARKT